MYSLDPDIVKINQTVRAKGKAFDAIIGCSYGRASGSLTGKVYRKILSAMKKYPTLRREEYDVLRTR